METRIYLKHATPELIYKISELLFKSKSFAGGELYVGNYADFEPLLCRTLIGEKDGSERELKTYETSFGCWRVKKYGN